MDEGKIKVNNVEYDVSTLSEEAKAQNKTYYLQFGFFNREPTRGNIEQGHISSYEDYSEY